MTNWKIAAPATMLALGFGISACDRTTVNEAAGNGQTYIDVTSDKAVDGQDITINRLRVTKSTANDNAPGVASVRDAFYIEMWATLSGETKPRYSRLSTAFYADPDGNLYTENFAPGVTTYNDTLGAALGTDISYTVTQKDAMISVEWDKVVEEQTTVTDTGSRTIVKKSLVTVSGQDSSLEQIRSRTYPAGAIFSRTRYQENKDFSVKGKLGCFNKTTASNGDVSYAEKPTWYDVELGNIISDKDGTISSRKTPTAVDDSSASDQILWVKWSENWYITGLNVNTNVLRIVRERSAPYYMARELPQRVFTAAAGGSSNISGIEKMVRACSNDVEVTSGSKSFTTVGFSGVSGTTYTAASGFTRLNGNGAAFCSGTKTVASTVALTTAISTGNPFSCTTSTLTSANLGFTVAAGTWDGTKSTGIMTSPAAGTFTYLDHSKIAEVQY